MVSTFYALCCLTATGLLITWSQGNPRIAATPDRAQLGTVICVTFPKGSRYSYTLADYCPTCKPDQIDILVRTRAQAVRLGVVEIELDKGRCP